MFDLSFSKIGEKKPEGFFLRMVDTKSLLIFQDATQQLVVLPEEQRDYRKYLDREFLNAYSLVECRSHGGVRKAANMQVVQLVLLFAGLISTINARIL